MAKFITLDNLSYFLGKVKTWVQGLGYQTAANVESIISGKGFATTSQVDSKVSTATADMATQTWVGEQGFQTSQQVETAITSKGYQTASQVNSAITAKGYDTATSVNSKISQAKTDMQSAIDAAVASVYTPKGSVAFASLPALSADIVGDVYNVSDAFKTTADFVEGAGKDYPAGTNVVCVTDGDAQKWDVLSGMVDLSGYVQDGDLEAVSNEDIDAMFSD